MNEEAFSPRPPVTIDWPRQFDSGPSDEHLHAIGQFIANYSLVEWQIVVLFSDLFEMRYETTQKLITEANMAMAGILRAVKSKVEESTSIDAKASKDLLHVIGKFEAISKVRHRIVHWQWGLTTGDAAYHSDLIRHRKSGEHKEITLSEIRKHCLDLMKILQAMCVNMLIINKQNTREEILRVRTDTSPETLFRALP